MSVFEIRDVCLRIYQTNAMEATRGEVHSHRDSSSEGYESVSSSISLRNFLAHLHDAAEEVQITAYLCTFHPTKYIMSDNGLISD